MEVQVLHFDRDGLGNRWFEHMATIDLSSYMFDNMGVEDALEYAYRHTQNLGGSWAMERMIDHKGELYENPDFNPHVIVVKPLDGENGKKWGHRSSMVGDRMIIDGEVFEVDTFGFKNVEGE